MQLDPQVRVFLDQLARSNAPAYPQLGVQGARDLYLLRADLNMPSVEVAEVFDTQAQTPSGPLALRVYRALDAEH